MGSNYYSGKQTWKQMREAAFYVLKYRPIIKYWAKYLRITNLTIKVESIEREQVIFPKELSVADRYFIGVAREGDIVTITYDRDMTEEDILHELLHVTHPAQSEDWVNAETTRLLKLK